MPASLNVVTFPVPDYKDPVKALRNLADQIESGDFGDIGSCGVVLFGDKMDVFGSGPDSEASVISLLFSAAALRFAKSIEEHGE